MLEITQILKEMTDSDLKRSIAVLNLPGANYCEKRAERVVVEGRLEQSCRGCVTQHIQTGSRLSIEQIHAIIDFFAKEYRTQIITINGRGDPFHPLLKDETLKKIDYASMHGITSYVFTAGNNLDEETCQFLAEHGVNVMVSLHGNKFIDADFFRAREYPTAEAPLQDQAHIAGNLRRLFRVYTESQNQPRQGLTRIGMNYVVLESDLENSTRLQKLQEAATNNGMFFVCNTSFTRHTDPVVQLQLEQLALRYGNARHTTFVHGRCQMGAGSSATVDYNGELFRCPYMSGKGDGNITLLSLDERRAVLERYMHDKEFVCTMRRTK